MTLGDELTKLGELHERGKLSDDEFARAKATLLSGTSATSANNPFASSVNALRRSRKDRWFGGVCAGLAQATGMETWAWRLIFTLLVICGGAGPLIYLMLWILVPSEP